MLPPGLLEETESGESRGIVDSEFSDKASSAECCAQSAAGTLHPDESCNQNSPTIYKVGK